MDQPISWALAVVVAWLLGALPVGLWLARRRGAGDPAASGSGSTGATNVGRLLGWRWGVLVGVLDVVKGALAVSLGHVIQAEPAWLPALLGLTAVAGHCWSPLALWRGGRGVATGAGAALVLAPVAAGYCLAAAALVLLVGRRMSPASLSGVALFPAILYLTGEATVVRLGFALVLTGLVWLRHRNNLARLAAGREAALWRWRDG